jgi:hypothetical protein
MGRIKAKVITAFGEQWLSARAEYRNGCGTVGVGWNYDFATSHFRRPE